MTLAHEMVWSLGMGGDGFIGDFSVIPAGQSMRGDQLSEALKEKLNTATQRILQECLTEVDNVLRTESRILDRFAAELLRREELDYDEIVSIFLEYGKPPRPIPLPPPGVPPA
jgi:ATP-dependent Zn protease